MCVLASTVALAVIPATSPAGAHDVKGDLSSNTAQTATEGSTFKFEVCRNSTKNDNFLWTQNVRRLHALAGRHLRLLHR